MTNALMPCKLVKFRSENLYLSILLEDAEVVSGIFVHKM